jgi:Mrp family chromosome partitioning ATPase
VIESLRESFDLVIVDAPPLLHIGDARVLSSYIDGIVVVTRLGSITRASLTELRRVLDASPVTGLGLVVTGAESSDPYRGAYRAESR